MYEGIRMPNIARQDDCDDTSSGLKHSLDEELGIWYLMKRERERHMSNGKLTHRNTQLRGG